MRNGTSAQSRVGQWWARARIGFWASGVFRFAPLPRTLAEQELDAETARAAARGDHTLSRLHLDDTRDGPAPGQ